MSKRITIKDIAKHFNVHHSTVSRALRNDKRVKEETRKLIISYAKKHGYQVNKSALHLRGEVKNMIAIVVPKVYQHFFSNIISMISDLASSNGYVVSVFQTNESYKQEKAVINSIIQQNIAGVIASVSMETLSPSHFKKLIKFGIPLVFFDRIVEDIVVPKVTINNKEIIFQALNMLVGNGYKQIAYITGTKMVPLFRERQNGYYEGIEANHLKYSKVFEASKYFSTSDGTQAVESLFSAPEKPDAIICDSHSITLGVLMKLQEKNINIPDQVGIIGHGANEDNLVITPNIASIVQPEKQLAFKSFELLHDIMLNNHKPEARQVIIPATVIERESCNPSKVKKLKN